MQLQQSPKTAQAAAGAAILNCDSGIVTTEALVTALGASYTLTLQCNAVTPNSIVVASLANGTNSQADPSLSRISAGNGVITFVVVNRSATLAFNGTLQISYVVFN
jgi:hypothetical protein